MNICLISSLMILGNLMSGEDNLIDEVIKLGALDFLETRLDDELNDSKIILIIIWICENLSSSRNFEHLNDFVEHSLFKEILGLLYVKKSKDVLNGIVVLLYNLTYECDLRLCVKLVENHSLIEILRDLLHNQEDFFILKNVLSILNEFFKFLKNEEDNIKTDFLIKRINESNILNALLLHFNNQNSHIQECVQYLYDQIESLNNDNETNFLNQ